jgi:uncharacterized membrane protein YfcA
MSINPEIMAVVVVAGLLCGFLNTVASSGSAVSLPVLLWVGLHAVDANATNRIPVLVGAIAATASFARDGAIPWRRTLLAAVPVTLGAAAGALLTEVIPSHDLRIVITGAVVAALILILTKLKDIVRSAAIGNVQLGWRPMLLLFFVGIWTGFIVLDCATYMLLVLVLVAGLPLVEANVIKNVLLVPTTVVAILIFSANQSVDWAIGGVMALGGIVGGLLGARLAISELARRWIVGLLITVIVAELVHLSIRYYLDLLG